MAQLILVGIQRIFVRYELNIGYLVDRLSLKVTAKNTSYSGLSRLKLFGQNLGKTNLKPKQIDLDIYCIINCVIKKIFGYH